MAEEFKRFYIDHVPTKKMHMQMHWHLLLSHWFFQLEQQRKYSSIDVTCTLQNSPLNSKAPKRNLQVKRSSRLQQVQDPRSGDSNSSTLSYTTYYLMILKRWLQSEGKLLGSTIMWSREHYIADRMIESYSATFHTKRHRRHSGKLVTVRTELTNPDLSLGTDSEDLLLLDEDDFWCYRLR